MVIHETTLRHSYTANARKCRYARMTYPGLMLLIGVGIGIATLLYYVFSENENDPQYEHSSNNGGPSDHRRDSRYLTSRPEILLSRRSASNSSRRLEELRATSREDINNCSICQYPLIESAVQLQDCKHKFHEDCIKRLIRQSINRMPSCPNCRTIINHVI